MLPTGKGWIVTLTHTHTYLLYLTLNNTITPSPYFFLSLTHNLCFSTITYTHSVSLSHADVHLKTLSLSNTGILCLSLSLASCKSETVTAGSLRREQCDQIGLFLKGLATNFLTKKPKYLSTCWAPLKKINAVYVFWATTYSTISGQFYKQFTLVNYDSEVVIYEGKLL